MPTSNHRTNPPGPSPAQLALQNWINQVGLLEAWEREEIDMVYNRLNELLKTYQSSAALAITRAALEIGLIRGQ